MKLRKITNYLNTCLAPYPIASMWSKNKRTSYMSHVVYFLSTNNNSANHTVSDEIIRKKTKYVHKKWLTWVIVSCMDTNDQCHVCAKLLHMSCPWPNPPRSFEYPLTPLTTHSLHLPYLLTYGTMLSLNRRRLSLQHIMGSRMSQLRSLSFCYLCFLV
jgi:hypothetical protein